MPVSSEAYGDLLVLHATKCFDVFFLVQQKLFIMQEERTKERFKQVLILFCYYFITLKTLKPCYNKSCIFVHILLQYGYIHIPVHWVVGLYCICVDELYYTWKLKGITRFSWHRNPHCLSESGSVLLDRFWGGIIVLMDTGFESKPMFRGLVAL